MKGRLLLLVLIFPFTVVYLQEAEPISSIAADTTRARVLILKVDSLTNRRNYTEARINLEETIALYERSIGKSNELSDAIYRNGLLFYLQGNYIEAINIWEKALEMRLNVRDPDQKRILGTYHNLGILYSALSQFDKAIQYKNKASEGILALFGPNHPQTAHSLNSLAVEYTNIGDFENSLAHHRKVIEIRRAQPDTLNVDLYRLIPASYHFGGFYLTRFNRTKKSEDLKLADQYFTLSEAAITKLTRGLGPDVRPMLVSLSSTNYKAKALNNYLLYKEIGEDRYFEKSFAFSEQSKAYALHQVMQESSAISFAGLPDSLLKKEERLRILITDLEKRKQDKIAAGISNSDSTILTMSDRLFSLKESYEKLKITFEVDFPQYYKLKYDFSTVDLKFLQDSLLTEKQTLLEYSVSDSSILIFTIQKNKQHIQEIKGSFTLIDWVKDLQVALTDYHRTATSRRSDELYKTNLKKYIDSATKLYDKLIAPIKDHLKEEVIIIPDGVLGYIPFEVLLSEKPSRTSSFDTYSFLFDDYNISYCYSATLLRQMQARKHEKPATKNFIAFAPFATEGYSKLEQKIEIYMENLPNGEDTIVVKEEILRKELAPLPNSGSEVYIASNLWQGDYLLGDDAQEETLTDIAQYYRVLHLSTHAVADERLGDYSYLAFAENPDSIENEYLYVRELYNLKLNADLVVLSACETSMGELKGGEGIISLARAFVYAGAKSMLTTLWVVDDAVAKDLTRDFYIHLKQGETKDRALYLAKKQHLQRSNNSRKHPFFWAAMIPVGDMSALR